MTFLKSIYSTSFFKSTPATFGLRLAAKYGLKPTRNAPNALIPNQNDYTSISKATLMATTDLLQTIRESSQNSIEKSNHKITLYESMISKSTDEINVFKNLLNEPGTNDEMKVILDVNITQQEKDIEKLKADIDIERTYVDHAKQIWQNLVDKLKQQGYSLLFSKDQVNSNNSNLNSRNLQDEIYRQQNHMPIIRFGNLYNPINNLGYNNFNLNGFNSFNLNRFNSFSRYL
jgi:hypothetical protein